MKKIFKILTILAVISFVFVACGTPPPEPKKEEPTPVVKEEPVVEETEPVVEETEPEPVTEEPSEVPLKEYIVVKGDTLSQIALKFYGTREKAYYFPIIMAVNPGVIKHPDKLEPKMKLLIPDFDLFMQHFASRELSKPEFRRCIDIYNNEGRTGVAESLKNRLEKL